LFLQKINTKQSNIVSFVIR